MVILEVMEMVAAGAYQQATSLFSSWGSSYHYFKHIRIGSNIFDSKVGCDYIFAIKMFYHREQAYPIFTITHIENIDWPQSSEHPPL